MRSSPTPSRATSWPATASTPVVWRARPARPLGRPTPSRLNSGRLERLREPGAGPVAGFGPDRVQLWADPPGGAQVQSQRRAVLHRLDLVLGHARQRLAFPALGVAPQLVELVEGGFGGRAGGIVGGRKPVARGPRLGIARDGDPHLVYRAGPVGARGAPLHRAGGDLKRAQQEGLRWRADPGRLVLPGGILFGSPFERPQQPGAGAGTEARHPRG